MPNGREQIEGTKITFQLPDSGETRNEDAMAIVDFSRRVGEFLDNANIHSIEIPSNFPPYALAMLNLLGVDFGSSTDPKNLNPLTFYHTDLTETDGVVLAKRVERQRERTGFPDGPIHTSPYGEADCSFSLVKLGPESLIAHNLVDQHRLQDQREQAIS